MKNNQTPPGNLDKQTKANINLDQQDVSARKINKKSLLIGLALALTLSMAAFAGYKYTKSNSKDAKSPSSEESKTITKEAPPAVAEAEMAGPESGEYEVELPEEWVTGSCADNPDIFFLAPNVDLLGKCQTEYFGTVSITKIEGDQRRTEEYYAADDYYQSAAFSTVEIDSLPGYRVSYSISQESELGYPPVGTFEYTYNLYDETEDVTYRIAYRQLPSDGDYQAEFITIAESFNKL
jgi:hypothetical protein